MDGRGRLVRPLNDVHARVRRRAADLMIGWQRALRRWLKPVIDLRLPRGLGGAVTALFLLASAGYGVVCGDLGPVIAEELRDLRDATANAFGLRITSISLAGQDHVTQNEIFNTAGVTARSSLLFLNAAAARARSRQILGSRKRASPSYIPGGCKSKSPSARLLRSGKRIARFG